MTPTQILLLVKIGAVGLLLLAVFMFGHRTGANGVQSDWDSEKAQFVAAQNKLILEHEKKIEAIRTKQYTDNIKVSEDHDRALQDLGKKYAGDIAAVRAAGGLRIPKSVCTGAVAGTETTSDGGRNENAASTVALPDSITNDLFAFAREADEIVEQARACQSWIRLNGFYTPTIY